MMDLLVGKYMQLLMSNITYRGEGYYCGVKISPISQK